MSTRLISMLNRELYLKNIRPYIDKPIIKVITGVRRAGKSAILQILMEELYEKGINKENVIYLNFESMRYSYVNNAEKLYSFIGDQITNKKKYYLLFDEIQEVKEWEKAINSFLVDYNCDVFITGSNSRLLSSELSTYIAGRYVEINILPLSFCEFLQFRKDLGENVENQREKFIEYLRLGGFPTIHISKYSEEQSFKIINDIYASAMFRDVINRNKIRNIELLEKIVKFIYDNIGNPFSAKKIVDYFKSQHRKVDIETVFSYLEALESAFIIMRIPRYDLKGKEILKTTEKYFLVDLGIKNATMGYHDRDISGALENIVLLELVRRGFKVFVGKIGNLEIDFVAERKNEKIYIQVAYKLPEKQTIDREFNALLKIKDNYPKYVVSMEDFWQDNIEGIKHKNIVDFLMMDEY